MAQAASDSARFDPDLGELIAASRAREARIRTLRHPERRPFLAALGLGLGFVAAASALAFFFPSQRELDHAAGLVLLVAYAVASRVRFEVSTGWAIPTQLFLVPMLFLLPPRLVPLYVAGGLLLGMLGRRILLEKALLRLANSWHAVGPALVFALAGAPSPGWDVVPLVALALVTQFALDFGSAAGYDLAAHGIRPQVQLRLMGQAYVVDAALTPLGLALAAAALMLDGAAVLALPLLGLLAVFARERKSRIDHALELSAAYRGTAMLLGDVVEADDAYTGSHSRDVVSLCLDVADRLGLEPAARRRVEFAALLHDVGKIRIPKEIINKPGKLDAAERALIETHTVEGEKMLERVGGLLGEIGHIVRSCHERWDGAGYPDRLAGEAIPIEARIVCACDAFSAMTTDRPYRKAMSLADAVTELEACAGTHFDAEVVEALVAAVAPR